MPWAEGHPEDFENVGVIIGAGMKLRMDADFQRDREELVGTPRCGVREWPFNVA